MVLHLLLMRERPDIQYANQGPDLTEERDRTAKSAPVTRGAELVITNSELTKICVTKESPH